MNAKMMSAVMLPEEARRMLQRATANDPAKQVDKLPPLPCLDAAIAEVRRKFPEYFHTDESLRERKFFHKPSSPYVLYRAFAKE